MEEVGWRLPNEGKMRARVQARRRQAQQIEAIAWEIQENAKPVMGVLEQAKHLPSTVKPVIGVLQQVKARSAERSARRFPVKLYALLVAVMLLTFCGLVLAPRGQSRGQAAGKNALAAALTPTSPAEDATMTEMRILSQVQPPDKPVRILVLGSDKRSDDPTFRTDVVMLVTVDGKNNQVSAVSFPRDLIAKIPGYGEDRINVVMEKGGFALMQDTLEQSYGARPDFYFMTNFNGFVDLINSIAGVEVNVAQPLTDACDLYWSQGGQCEVQPGKITMDGASALWYIRSRHTSSDFDRLRRAQEVMVGVFSRFMNMHAIMRLPELYDQYKKDVETNMDIPQMLALMPTAVQAIRDPKRIHRYAISPAETADWLTAGGAQVLLPDYDAIRAIVKEASFAP